MNLEARLRQLAAKWKREAVDEGYGCARELLALLEEHGKEDKGPMCGRIVRGRKYNWVCYRPAGHTGNCRLRAD